MGSIHVARVHPGWNSSDLGRRRWADPGLGYRRRPSPAARWRGIRSRFIALALGPDGRQLASAGADGSIKIWELAEGRLIRSMTGHTNWIFGLAFHPNGTRIASAGADGTVRLWEAAGGREILTLRGHHDRVHGVAFSPDGTRLASASADGVVRIWETDLHDRELERGN